MNHPIQFSYATEAQPFLMRNFIRCVERVTGQAKLKSLYLSHISQARSDESFFEAAIRLLDLNIDVRGTIPDLEGQERSVLFIANHPYGVLDGVVFAALTQRMRADTKVMANSVLCQAPEARPHLLPVDFAGTREAMQINLDTRKTALQMLQAGGSVGLFPGGGVAASCKPLNGPAVDPTWSPFLAKLVRKSKPMIVPIYFAGQNSRLFQIASHTSYPLRLSLFFRETRRMMGKTIRIGVGAPIDGGNLADVTDNAELIAHLRRATFRLAETMELPKRQIQKPDDHYIYPARFAL